MHPIQFALIGNLIGMRLPRVISTSEKTLWIKDVNMIRDFETFTAQIVEPSMEQIVARYDTWLK
jgi:hypothetical protein